MEPKTIGKKRSFLKNGGQQKSPRQPKLTRATETKSNQADLEKFTVCVMGSTRIKEKSCRVDALHMRYRGREFESLLVKPNPPS